MEQEELISKLTSLADRFGYSVEAYLFILRGMEFAVTHVPKERWHIHQGNPHLDATDVCWSLIDYAILQFGEDAQQQLQAWKIHRSSDMGAMIQHLVDAELARTSDEDQWSDFDDVFTVEEAFRDMEGSDTGDRVIVEAEPDDDRESPTRGPIQFSLTTVLIASVLVAVVVMFLKWDYQRRYGYQATIDELASRGATVVDVLHGGSYPVSIASASSEVRDIILPGAVGAQEVRLLSRLPELRSLQILMFLHDVNKGPQLYGLQKLDLLLVDVVDAEAIPRLAWVAPNLEELSFFGIYDGQSQHLRQLHQLKKLKTLSLGFENTYHLDGLSTCQTLESLEIRLYANASPANLSELQGCNALQRLTLAGEGVDDRSLGMIQTLPHLRQLTLRGTNVSDTQIITLRNWEQLDKFVVESEEQ